MSKTKRLITQLEAFFNDVVTPQLSLYETEYTEKEKIFDKRIDLLRQELASHPHSTPAEILHPSIYNINEEYDKYATIIDKEEVAE